jgi:hypothetical protein
VQDLRNALAIWCGPSACQIHTVLYRPKRSGTRIGRGWLLWDHAEPQVPFIQALGLISITSIAYQEIDGYMSDYAHPSAEKSQKGFGRSQNDSTKFEELERRFFENVKVLQATSRFWLPNARGKASRYLPLCQAVGVQKITESAGRPLSPMPAKHQPRMLPTKNQHHLADS